MTEKKGAENGMLYKAMYVKIIHCNSAMSKYWKQPECPSIREKVNS